MTGFVTENKGNLSHSSDEVFFVRTAMKVKQKLLSAEMKIDTGAPKSVISEETLDRLLSGCEESVMNWIKQDREQTKNSLKFGSGNTAQAEKLFHLQVIWKNIQLTLRLNVIEQNVSLLLGVQALSKMGFKVYLSEQTMVKEQKRPIERNDIRHIACRGIKNDVHKIERLVLKIYAVHKKRMLGINQEKT